MKSLLPLWLRPRTALRTWRGVRRLRRELRATVQRRIVVGSEEVFEPGWIPTDITYLNLLKPVDWDRFFAPDSLDAILAEHVWEHLSVADGLTGARTCHAYLKPGAYLRLAVPDALHPDPGYREQTKPAGSGPGATDHKIHYTLESLSALLHAAGFEVKPLEYFDAGGNFHETDWSPADGMIHRSRRFDERNRDGELRYTSLIVDAYKPAS